MKKLLVSLCLVVMIFCLVGCDNGKEKTVTRPAENSGFVVIERLGKYGDTYLFLVYDVETKVEYIFVNGYSETSLCPYYDENGEVVIYKGE